MTAAAQDVDVVVPVYRNAATLAELHERIAAALGARLRAVVYVDDGSPDESRAVLETLASEDERARIVARPANGGQQRALLDGLRASEAAWVVTIDADLQDPPEAIPSLLDAAAAAPGGRPQAVFGGRRGRYESRGRLLTSHAFKRTLGVLAAVPADASSFTTLPRAVVDDVLALDGPAPYLTGMIAATGAPCTSVPVERARAERSGYSGLARLRSAGRGLRWGLRARRARSSRGAEDHNQVQLDYYASRESTSIQPRPTRYARRQVDEAIAAGDLRPGERVLDVGCGLGRATLLLAGAGLRVEGADLSPLLLARLARVPGAEGIPLREADVAAPPPELLGRFDVVCGFFVLHHLHDLDAALAGARAALKPGGRVVFVEPNAYCPLFYVQVAAVRGMSFRADGGIVRMRPGRLASACATAGFTQVEQRTFGMLPPFAVNRPRGAALERGLEGLPGVAPVRAFRLLTARLPGDVDRAA